MKRSIQYLVILTAIMIILGGCNFVTTMPPGTANTSAVQEPNWGQQTKTRNCHSQGSLQDTACTPGDIFPQVMKADICRPGYASSVRNVPVSIKNKVYTSYGITKRRPGQYEVDHLVSLQLGGSNNIANLWPEGEKPLPGYKEKNRVESYLRDQVCNGRMTLRAAQIAIATNWLKAYNAMPDKNGNSENDDNG